MKTVIRNLLVLAIVAVVSAAPAVAAVYSYDATGNRLSEEVTTSTSTRTRPAEGKTQPQEAPENATAAVLPAAN